MVTVVLVPFDDSKPLESQTLCWKSRHDDIRLLLKEADYLATPLVRPREIEQQQQQNFTKNDSIQTKVAGLYAFYNNPEQRKGRENIRATRLAMACGLLSLRFWGDVLLVRSYTTEVLIAADECDDDDDVNGTTAADAMDHRWGNLEISSLIGALCLSPDLRVSIQHEVAKDTKMNVNLVASPPDWLAEAAQQNYHDSAAIAQLASVMNLDGKRNEHRSDDDVNSDGSDDENEQEAKIGKSFPANDSSSYSATTKRRGQEQIQQKQNKSFVAHSSLCLHCRGPCTSQCVGCKGAYFCSPPRTCSIDGWSHSCLCRTWNIYTSHRSELSSFPYFASVVAEKPEQPWQPKLVGRNLQTDESPYQNFLESFGILLDVSSSSDENNENCNNNISWWRTEIDGWAGGESKSAELVDPTVRRSYIDGFAPIKDIPSECHCLYDKNVVRTNSVGLQLISSWEEYYKLRQIPSSSPIALLCTFPVTIYYSILKYGEVPSTVARMLKRPLRIHIVGVEKELHFLDLFKEVGFLCPKDFKIELVFVVREDMLPQNCRNRHSTGGLLDNIELTSNLTAHVVTGTYGDDSSLDPNFDCGSGPPDMIIGLNAGLYAYESWRSVITYLYKHSGVVGVFTDYNEFSGINCAAIGGSKCRNSLFMNPFRQPRAMPVYSMNLPQFSNGFLYVFNEQELE